MGELAPRATQTARVLAPPAVLAREDAAALVACPPGVRRLDAQRTNGKTTVARKMYLATGWLVATSGISTVALAAGMPTLGALFVLYCFLLPPAFGLFSLGERLARVTGRAARRWRYRQAPVVTSVSEQAPGALVRLRGRVLPGPTFTTAGGRPEAVLVAYAGTVTNLRDRPLDGPITFRREVHALPFTLALATGERVSVGESPLQYLGGPPPLTPDDFEARPLSVRPLAAGRRGPRVAAVYTEEVVAVGDEVEVLGRLHRDVDPQEEAGYRGSRLRAVLHGSRRRPVLIAKAT